MDPPNMLARFTYDGNGRRASKTAGGVTTTYVYDGNSVLQELTSTGSARRYLYHSDGDGPLAVVDGVASYYLADHLQSVVRTTDTLGGPTLIRQYDPWGNALQGSGTIGYAFTGREWDTDLNLYYFKARYYNSNVGRFISEDPIGLGAGEVNLYAYAANQPTIATDPTGLDTYVINRSLGRDVPLPPGALLSHTFVATTCTDGSVDATYSWGNRANPRGWNKDQPEDLTAAKGALKLRWGKWVGGEDLDPKVAKAFDELNRKANQHRNLGIVWNCKTEAAKLIARAKQMR
jgi:RHS repeat-associated protein